MRLATGFGFLLSLAISFTAAAQDFKKLVGDFSANSLHTSVSGAGTLGDIFGVEVGLIGGLTNTPELDKLVKEASPGNKAEQLPHAELIAMVSVPLGFTIEAGFVPKVGNDDFKYQNLSLAAKWTPTTLFFELPLDLAIKAHMTKTEVEAQSVVSSVNTTYKFENNLVGLTAFASKDFIFAAPYIGFGMVKAEGDLTANGAAVFDPSYTASASASEKDDSTLLLVGSEFKLLVLKLGVEYARMFDTDRYTAKFSFYF
jgi:hypothetical protein